MQKHRITRDDILPMEEYGGNRKQRRREISTVKQARRVSCGPDATFYFESHATMWHQIHEMLWVEKGGEAQIADELAAYNPLIPKGRELVATLMIEITDEGRRRDTLARLGGVEETVSFRVDGEEIRGVPEADMDRTTAAGKASAVQFLHFPFSDVQVAKFRAPGARVELAIGHPEYGHIAVLTEEVRAALADDFD